MTIAPVTPEDRAKLLDAPPLQPGTLPAAGERHAVTLCSGFFITDPSAQCAELWDPIVSLHETELWESEPLVALLEQVEPTGRQLFIAAPAIRGDALALLQINHLRGRVTGICAVDAPLATIRALPAQAKRIVVIADQMTLIRQ